MIYFTSDQHYFHNRIIGYCNRPFDTCKDMDSTIFRLHNDRIAEDDTVYMLGDFTLCGSDYIRKIERHINGLNGRKILILGNHDYLKAMQYVDIGFESVHTSLEVEGYTLIHDPAICQDPTKKYLCGHVHNVFKKQGNVLNVGVDVNNFAPVSLAYVNSRFT